MDALPATSFKPQFRCIIQVTGSILQQYVEAVRVARLGLRANPEDATLVNNLAFALINCGELVDAERNLRTLRSADLERPHQILLRATTGLLLFRRGDLKGGANSIWKR